MTPPPDSLPSFSPPATHAPTMGNLAKTTYTHDAMIDLLIVNPHMSQGQLAIHFGYSQGWISNIMASDAWQAKYASRVKEIVDPALILSLEEKLRGMTHQAIDRIQEKLANSNVADSTVLKAIELGAKSLGLGNEHRPPEMPSEQRLEALAHRLIDLQASVKRGVTYDATSPIEDATLASADSRGSGSGAIQARASEIATLPEARAA